MYNQPEVALEKYELTVSRHIYVTQASGRSCSCRTEGMSKGQAPCGIRWHLSRETVWMWSRYHRQRSSVSYREITVRTHTY